MIKLADDASEADKMAWDKYLNDRTDVGILMIGSMENDTQDQFMEFMNDPQEMMEEIKTYYQKNSRAERYDTLRELFLSRLNAGDEVGPHVLKMKHIFDRLASPGHTFSEQLKSDIVLISLPKIYGDAIIDCNFHNMDMTIKELIRQFVTLLLFHRDE